MAITPLSTPLKTEYKPLGLEAFAQPLSQMQAKFDVAKSQIEDADYKINRLNWSPGEEEKAKELAGAYNQKATDLAGKLLRSGNYREASSALKGINKSYNNDPHIQALQSNAAGYKAAVAEMDKAVAAKEMTPEYRKMQIQKIQAGFPGTNFDPKTGEYNKINASSAMNNIAIEDKIMQKAEKLSSANAEQQDFILGKEVTTKLRDQSGHLAFEDIVAHLRQSSEFKEYSKEKAELEFFTQNQAAMQSEDPFALADALIGTRNERGEYNGKIGEIDRVLGEYAKNPEAAERDKKEIEKLLNAKEELLALEENKTQDPQSYFNTAEDIYVANHDYIRGVGKTAADIYDYQKIDIDDASSSSTKKTIEEAKKIGAFSTELSGTKGGMTVGKGADAIGIESIAKEAGLTKAETELGPAYSKIDSDFTNESAAKKGQFVYTGPTIKNNIAKTTLFVNGIDKYNKSIENNKNSIKEKLIELNKETDLAEKRKLEAEIKTLEVQNARSVEAKELELKEFNSLLKLQGPFNRELKDNISSAEDRIALQNVYNQYQNDPRGYLQKMNELSLEYATDKKILKKIKKAQITEKEGTNVAYNITSNSTPFTEEQMEEYAKNYNSTWEMLKAALMGPVKYGKTLQNNKSLAQKQKELAVFNAGAGTNITMHEMEDYRRYINNEHKLPENLKSTTVQGSSARDVMAAGGNFEATGEVEYGPNAEGIIRNAEKVGKAVEAYTANYNNYQEELISNENNPYKIASDILLTGYERAHTIENNRIVLTNNVVIDDHIKKAAPSAETFINNTQNNLARYVVDYNPATKEFGKDKLNTNFFKPNLYDTKTMRAVDIIGDQTIYAINRKKDKDLSSSMVAAAFSGQDKKETEIGEGEGLMEQNKKTIESIKRHNKDVIYISDKSSNNNIMNEARLTEVTLLQKLMNAEEYNQGPELIQAQNTALNNLANIELLDVNKRQDYVTFSSNIQENLKEGVASKFVMPPSVVSTASESYSLEDKVNGKLIAVNPGDKVYNTVIYETDNSGKLSYRLIRKILRDRVGSDGKQILDEILVEQDTMPLKQLPVEFVKHSIRFGVGESSFNLIDEEGQIFNTELGHR